MFCPQCGSEFRQGFTHCNDCDVDLVWELPRDEHADPNLVQVFQSANPVLIATADSLLRSEEIPCVIRNKYIHDSFLGEGALRQPAQFWVRDSDAEDARELLADLVSYDGAQGHEAE